MKRKLDMYAPWIGGSFGVVLMVNVVIFVLMAVCDLALEAILTGTVGSASLRMEAWVSLACIVVFTLAEYWEGAPYRRQKGDGAEGNLVDKYFPWMGYGFGKILKWSSFLFACFFLIRLVASSAGDGLLGSPVRVLTAIPVYFGYALICAALAYWIGTPYRKKAQAATEEA